MLCLTREFLRALPHFHLELRPSHKTPHFHLNSPGHPHTDTEETSPSVFGSVYQAFSGYMSSSKWQPIAAI